MGGKRQTWSTGTSDIRIAATIRDRILPQLLAEIQTGAVARNLIATVSAADENGADLLARANRELGMPVSTGPTLSESAARFIENRRDLKKRSGHTVDDYARSLAAFQRVVGDVPLVQITSKDLRGYRDTLRQVGRRWCRGGAVAVTAVDAEKRLSARTVVKTIKNLITFFNWAVREELIDRNPAANVELPTVERNPTPSPPTELADALCALLWPVGAELGVLEWEVLPFFYRYTGARCGEICQLTAADIVVEQGVRCMRIVTEKTTNRSARTQTGPKRLVPVHPKLAPHLDRVLAERGDQPSALLFRHAGTRQIQSPNGDFNRYGWGWGNLYNRRVKVVWPKMHVHCWRAYAITEMARAGIAEEVRRRVVGHAIAGVHDGYNQVHVQRLKEAVEAIP
jgi:integrase